MKHRTSKAEKGVTLVALIVTIIVMLIIAGIAITAVTGGNGILSRAKNSTATYNKSKAEEAVALILREYQMDNVESGKDYKTFLDERVADNSITSYKINDDGSSEIVKDGFTIGVDKELNVASSTGSGSGSSGSGSSSGSSSSGSSGSSTSESSNASGTGGSVEKPTVPKLTEDEVYGSTLKRKNALPITQANLIYADYNNDGYADGIIVADASGNAVTTDKIGTGDFADYSVREFDYLNASNQATVKGYLVTRTKASNKFYVLALADYDSSTSHTWYKNASGKMTDYNSSSNSPTSIEIGTGENNTRLMIQRMAYHDKLVPDYGPATDGDMWQILQTRPTGWFVPSKNEWNAFLTNLKAQGLTTSTYNSNFGLNSWYWSSSQGSSSYAWRVGFGGGDMGSNNVNTTDSVRLCATF